MDEITQLWPLCEVCGRPSRHKVVDFVRRPPIQVDDAGRKWPTLKRDGHPHYFCDEHKRESRERDDFGPVAEQAVVEPDRARIRVGELEVTCDGPSVRNCDVRLDGKRVPLKRLVITLDMDKLGPPLVEMTWYPTMEFTGSGSAIAPKKTDAEKHAELLRAHGWPVKVPQEMAQKLMLLPKADMPALLKEQLALLRSNGALTQEEDVYYSAQEKQLVAGIDFGLPEATVAVQSLPPISTATFQSYAEFLERQKRAGKEAWSIPSAWLKAGDGTITEIKHFKAEPPADTKTDTLLGLPVVVTDDVPPLPEMAFVLPSPTSAEPMPSCYWDAETVELRPLKKVEIKHFKAEPECGNPHCAHCEAGLPHSGPEADKPTEVNWREFL